MSSKWKSGRKLQSCSLFVLRCHTGLLHLSKYYPSPSSAGNAMCGVSVLHIGASPRLSIGSCLPWPCPWGLQSWVPAAAGPHGHTSRHGIGRERPSHDNVAGPAVWVPSPSSTAPAQPFALISPSISAGEAHRQPRLVCSSACWQQSGVCCVTERLGASPAWYTCMLCIYSILLHSLWMLTSLGVMYSGSISAIKIFMHVVVKR